jgi:hypothetical protein
MHANGNILVTCSGSVIGPKERDLAVREATDNTSAISARMHCRLDIATLLMEATSSCNPLHS